MSHVPMTPRRRVELALAGGHADKVPFTLYECMARQCAAERQMRNRGMCILDRSSPVFRVHTPNVRVTRTHTTDAGREMVRTVYQTPVGSVWTLQEPAGFTSWTHQRMFTGPEDYKTLLFLIRDRQYEPTYDRFLRAQAAFGPDAIFRANIGLEPLQALVSGDFMAMETFCLEWMDRRDEVLRLYEALVQDRRKVYPIVADSPAGHANYGGNVVAAVIGRENFARYYVPHYNEAAEALHRRGKRIGCHFDGDCRLLAQDIAATDLDYVEAFTPAPNSDMTLAQARHAWPDKVLWINFPSSLHLADDGRVADAAEDLIDQACGPDGLIIGITEDMPEDRWRDSCLAIMDGIDRHARRHPDRYA